MRAAGIERQRVQRGQQLGYTELQQRVREQQVFGVFRERRRQLVVRHAGEEQHVGVVEVVAELGLGPAHRPFEEDLAEPGAGGHRHPGHGLLHAHAVALDETARAQAMAVLRHAEADRIGLLVPLPEQLDRLGGAAIGAEAAHPQLRAEEGGRELEILAACTKTDADHGLHSFSARK